MGAKIKPKTEASEIKIALAKHHHEKGDFYLDECKSGSTYHGTANRILDGVAIRRSYSKPQITGYEIKVTRGDFLSDNKYTTYLPLVHRLYIVCPEKLIEAVEIPVEVGLMWYVPAKGVLRVKRRPQPRLIEISRDMLLYIICSRLDPDRVPFYSNKKIWFRKWLENEMSNADLAHNVRNKMTAEIDRLESELRHLKRASSIAMDERAEYGEVKKALQEHGMRWNDKPVEWLKNRLESDCNPLVDGILHDLSNAVGKLKIMKGEIDNAKP